MGLTKDYLRFKPSRKFNVITNKHCNIVGVKESDKYGRYVAAGAAEDVVVWDCKFGKKIRVIDGDKQECVYLGSHLQTDRLAIGYRDGTVNLYGANDGELLGTFCGHSSTITTIAFDHDGHRLATGSLDTDVVVWDVIAEQGLFRLSGHKGSVTRAQFMRTRDIIVTSSKDSFVKFWDLKNGHCFKTLTGHVTEVWSFCLMKDDSYLVTGTNDSELRVWSIADKDPGVDRKSFELTATTNDDIEFASPIECVKLGSILRQGIGRVASLWTDDSTQILACHGNEKLLEVFRFLPEEEVIRKYNKKRKKAKKKLGERLHGDEQFEPNENDKSSAVPPITSLVFRVARLAAVKTRGKVRSAIIGLEKGGQRVKTIVATNSNTLEVHTVDIDCKESELEKVVTGPGHDSDVRCIAFDDADNTSLVSGSATGLKLWNCRSSSCLRTIHTEYVLSVCFAPGGRYVVAGLKNGSLAIADVASADVIETIEAAHAREVWRVAVLPDKSGCISCGGDGTIKIWNLEWLSDDSGGSSGVLTLIHAKTLKLDEPALDVSVTSDGNLIAVALLDCSVKIFFNQSFKFFLNLYGHKLPVACLDVSYDSTILATGSADRHVKIWGLDYGDCHRSIFAHDDTVTALRFVPNTHYFFTCGKDGSVKQWDADNYQRILTLPGHRGEAWCLSISGDGLYVASSGQDRVIRMYEKSSEPLVLEDEREVERQQQEEEALATGAESVLYGRAAMHLASRKTVNAEIGAELLLECLQVLRQLEETTPSSLPPIMLAFNAQSGDQYLTAVLRKIRASDLEEILSLLPFASACHLLERTLPLLDASHSETETVCRVVVFLLRAHHRPIMSSRNLFLVLQKLEAQSRLTLSQLKDIVGYNLHALFHLLREKELRENVRMFQQALAQTNKLQTKKRKKQSLASTAVLKL